MCIKTFLLLLLLKPLKTNFSIQTLCVDKFISTFFTERPIFIANGNQTKLIEILDEFNLEEIDYTIYNTENLNILEVLPKQRYNYLLIGNIEDIIEKILKRVYDINGKYLLIPDDYTFEDNLLDLVKFGVHKIIVLIKGNLHVWHPYTKQSKCGKVINLEPIDTCDETLNPFTKQAKENNGCELQSLSDLREFRQHDVESDEPTLFIDVLRILSKWTGMELALSLTNDSEKSICEDFYEWKPLTNLLNQLKVETPDIIVCSFDSDIVDYPDFGYEMSNFLLELELLWLLPDPKPLNYISALLLNASSDIVISFSLISLAFFLFWYVNNRLYETGNFFRTFWNLLAVSLGQNFNENPSISMKFSKMLFFLMFLYMSFYFCSLIISYMTSPVYPPEPVTMEDLLELNYPFQYFSQYDAIIKLKNATTWQAIQKKRIPDADGDVLDLMYNFNHSQAITVLTSLSRELLANPEDVRILPERIATFKIFFMLLKKNFYLNDRINFLIRELHETGLIQHLFRKHVWGLQITAIIIDEPLVKPLTFEDIEYIFYLYVTLNVVAIIVFLGEFILGNNRSD